MYIKFNAVDNVVNNVVESLIKREEEPSDEDDENSTMAVATRISTIFVVISWYIYGKYAILCTRGLIRHKNFNFLFPLGATLFAFANNTNDIANYIYHPSNCYLFYLFFVGSATLNWAPISWLQAYRLALIAKIYLKKIVAIIIISLAVIFSTIYCTFYFLNLSLFDYTKTAALGCGVTNPGKWTPYIMISDIADSVFSLASICIIVFKSINHLKELNTRNEKLNDLVGQGVVELFVIGLAKIIIYPLIHLTSSIPGLDVFWDVLSIIVIISAYNLVNFPYEHSDKSGKNRISLRKTVFRFIDTIGGTGVGSSNNESFNKSSKKSSYIISKSKVIDSDSKRDSVSSIINKSSNTLNINSNNNSMDSHINNSNDNYVSSPLSK